MSVFFCTTPVPFSQLWDDGKLAARFFFVFLFFVLQLAAAVAMNGDLPRAEVLHREALSIMERTLGEKPHDT